MAERMKIMVVDDNTVNLATVEQELKGKYEVIPMISGRRAVKYLYKERVDMILLDVQMPIMDGIETLRDIRAQPNGTTVPVIFLTAKKDRVTVVEGSKLGIMDFITKPFVSEDLHNRIERVFKRTGRLPMNNEEVLERVKEILLDFDDENDRAAAFKMEEVLGYQIAEEVSGRILNAKLKLAAGERQLSIELLERVFRMLENEINRAQEDIKPMGLNEIDARLRYIIIDMENFKIKESKMKIENLMKFELPDYVMMDLQIIKIKLDNYDDAEAERLTRLLLEKVKKNK